MSCYSMTGFARQTVHLPSETSLLMEAKTLNHRYIQITFRLPTPYAPLEEKWRKTATQILKRGKVHIAIHILQGGPQLRPLNEPFLVQAAQQWKQLFPQEPIPPTLLLVPSAYENPWVAVSPEEEKVLDQAFHQLLEVLMEARRKEGIHLERALLGYIQKMRKLLETIHGAVPKMREKAIQWFREAVQALDSSIPIPPEKMDREILLLVQKMDMEEEIVRSLSHLGRMEEIITGEPMETGKTLNFYIQELRRELSTMIRKARETQIKDMIVQCQVWAEHCMEQVQNIL